MKTIFCLLCIFCISTALADHGIDKYWIQGEAYYKNGLLKNQQLQLKVFGLNSQGFTFNDTLITITTDSSGLFNIPYYYISPCDVYKYKIYI